MGEWKLRDRSAVSTLCEHSALMQSSNTPLADVFTWGRVDMWMILACYGGSSAHFCCVEVIEKSGLHLHPAATKCILLRRCLAAQVKPDCQFRKRSSSHAPYSLRKSPTEQGQLLAATPIRIELRRQISCFCTGLSAVARSRMPLQLKLVKGRHDRALRIMRTSRLVVMLLPMTHVVDSLCPSAFCDVTSRSR